MSDVRDHPKMNPNFSPATSIVETARPRAKKYTPPPMIPMTSKDTSKPDQILPQHSTMPMAMSSTPATTTGVSSERVLNPKATDPSGITIVNVTASPEAGRFGSFLTSINKSVSSALNNLLLFQQQDFTTGLKPEHAPPPVGVGRTVSESNVHGVHGHMQPSPSMTTRAPTSHSTLPNRTRSRSPVPDIGFSTAVSDIVDAAHAIREEDRRPSSFRRRGK